MSRPTPLIALQQKVHRFTGVIDRFGSFVVNGDTIHTVCVRDLCQASCRQSLEPGHWWFPLREIWLQASIQIGDTVLFTAKVQRVTKGWHDPDQSFDANPRRQVIGFAAAPRSVLVLRRHEGSRQQFNALQHELAQCRLHLAESSRDHEQLGCQYAALLECHQALQQQLTLISAPACSWSFPRADASRRSRHQTMRSR
ncbi:hypothetical protein [Synechococcus sp. CBW1108]|uniref:hypothetical protein n=1 Tax=Synechococcus sp. CBW1108 TaxID=1353147 RepID=UPI0018CFB237|nr:hypothetical protein [Synechococcus sp. CBW1108]QPN70115.1 hypothetical protein H8F27_17115 [Synechococcus sp. CBW1108]